MTHALRVATMEDRHSVEAIVQAAYSHYIPRIGRPPGPMLDDYSSLIRKGHVHVIQRCAVVEGLLVLIPEKDGMLLDNVAVIPAAQGIGLGQIMIEFAEQTARNAGYRSIRLYTNEAMIENIKLYSSLGYAETHRSEEKGLRRIYMTEVLV